MRPTGSVRSLGHLVPLILTIRWWQADAEAGDGQTQQDLARPEQVGDLRGAEQLELGEPGGILLRPCDP